jgi:hypothetical protein
MAQITVLNRLGACKPSLRNQIHGVRTSKLGAPLIAEQSADLDLIACAFLIHERAVSGRKPPRLQVWRIGQAHRRAQVKVDRCVDIKVWPAATDSGAARL